MTISESTKSEPPHPDGGKPQMDNRLILRFLEQARSQCVFIVMADRRINEWFATNEGLAANDDGVDENANPRDIFWYTMQNLIVAAGNVSKALWGFARKKNKADEVALKRKSVRDALGVGNLTDESPLRFLQARNDYEHFDERLQAWWDMATEKKVGYAFADRNIYPRGSNIVFNPPIREAYFRHYDQNTETLLFWSEPYEIRAIVNETYRLLPLVRAAIERVESLVRSDAELAAAKLNAERPPRPPLFLDGTSAYTITTSDGRRFRCSVEPLGKLKSEMTWIFQDGDVRHVGPPFAAAPPFLDKLQTLVEEWWQSKRDLGQ